MSFYLFGNKCVHASRRNMSKDTQGIPSTPSLIMLLKQHSALHTTAYYIALWTIEKFFLRPHSMIYQIFIPGLAKLAHFSCTVTLLLAYSLLLLISL